ncbi:aspartate aminotransferase, partial [Haematococcus lacustris]
MAGRIKQMRAELAGALRALGVPGDWSFIERQIGMFTFTGLTRPQCEALTARHHVYLTMGQ